jgi:CBS-domain-containing membrane protein
MVWLKVPHPPAGATTLIVSLGLIATIPKLGVLMLGVLLLVGQGFVINRLAGIDYPLWAPRTDPR